jgi:hypothetical protein
MAEFESTVACLDANNEQAEVSLKTPATPPSINFASENLSQDAQGASNVDIDVDTVTEVKVESDVESKIEVDLETEFEVKTSPPKVKSEVDIKTPGSSSKKKIMKKRKSPMKKKTVATATRPTTASYLQATKSSKNMCIGKHSSGNIASCGSGSLHSKSVGDLPGAGLSKWKPGRLTQPLSPNLRVNQRAGHGHTVMSTEEREMAAVEAAKQKESERMKKARANVERMKFSVANPMQTAVRSTKQLTIPVTPVSRLASRKGERYCSTAKLANGTEKEHDKCMKSKTGKSVSDKNKFNATLTVPEPFKFRTDDRIHGKSDLITSSNEPWSGHTMAEIAAKFTQDARSYNVPKHTKFSQNGPTIPVEPQFHTVTSRPKIKSTVEKEEDLMREFAKKSFKAKPVNKHIFESNGELGVPQVRAKSLTKPIDIHFRSDDRVALRASMIPTGVDTKVKTPEKNNTKQNIKKILAPYMTGRPTIPSSPKLHGGRRASMAPSHRQKPPHRDAQAEKKAKEEEERKKAMAPMKLELTQPKPFSLKTESRGSIYKKLEESNLARNEKALEDARQVRKNEVPNFDHPFCPKPSQKQLTETQPFHLRSEQRHELAVEQQQKNVQEMLESMYKAAEFHAQPIPKAVLAGNKVTSSHESSKVPLTVPMDINLASNRRAESRKAFDEQNVQRLKEMEHQKKLTELFKEDKENKEIQRLRRTSFEAGGFAFVAKEIMQEDPYPVEGYQAPLPLTEPQSPFLLTKRRSQLNQAS